MTHVINDNVDLRNNKLLNASNIMENMPDADYLSLRNTVTETHSVSNMFRVELGYLDEVTGNFVVGNGDSAIYQYYDLTNNNSVIVVKRLGSLEWVVGTSQLTFSDTITADQSLQLASIEVLGTDSLVQNLISRPSTSITQVYYETFYSSEQSWSFITSGTSSPENDMAIVGQHDFTLANELVIPNPYGHTNVQVTYRDANGGENQGKSQMLAVSDIVTLTTITLKADVMDNGIYDYMILGKNEVAVRTIENIKEMKEDLNSKYEEKKADYLAKFEQKTRRFR